MLDNTQIEEEDDDDEGVDMLERKEKTKQDIEILKKCVYEVWFLYNFSFCF